MKIKYYLSIVLILSSLSCSVSKKSNSNELSSYSLINRTKGKEPMLKGLVQGSDGLPASNIQILSLGRGQGTSTLTDDKGYFELNVHSGELQLDLMSPECGNVRTKPLLVAPKENVELNIVLGADERVQKARQQNKSIDKAGTLLGQIGHFFLRVVDFFTPKDFPL